MCVCVTAEKRINFTTLLRQSKTNIVHWHIEVGNHYTDLLKIIILGGSSLTGATSLTFGLRNVSIISLLSLIPAQRFEVRRQPKDRTSPLIYYQVYTIEKDSTAQVSYYNSKCTTVSMDRISGYIVHN